MELKITEIIACVFVLNSFQHQQRNIISGKSDSFPLSSCHKHHNILTSSSVWTDTVQHNHRLMEFLTGLALDRCNCTNKLGKNVKERTITMQYWHKRCLRMPQAATEAKQSFALSLGSSSCLGVFTLCKRACGVQANESQAQWYSDRTQGPLEGP